MRLSNNYPMSGLSQNLDWGKISHRTVQNFRQGWVKIIHVYNSLENFHWKSYTGAIDEISHVGRVEVKGWVKILHKRLKHFCPRLSLPLEEKLCYLLNYFLSASRVFCISSLLCFDKWMSDWIKSSLFKSLLFGGM